MDTISHVPPGFRFHPTDEELVDYYLRKKVALPLKRIDPDIIKDVDLYKIEPWDLQELCKIGSGSEEENEWYFFSHKDKKYPTGTRTNRATKAGFWKATGRDKAIYTKHCLIGMRKTLVFYKGRAPNGQKSDWIMHEYRLETNENATPQEEGWVVCRVFKKRMSTMRKMGEYESPCWYEDQSSFMQDLESPRRNNNNNPYYACKQELELQYNNIHEAFLQLPQLESPKFAHHQQQSSPSPNNIYTTNIINNAYDHHHHSHSNNTNVNGFCTNMHSQIYGNIIINDHQSAGVVDDQVTDWRVLDKFVASQLSQEDQHATNKQAANYNSNMPLEHQYASTPTTTTTTTTTTCHIDTWK